MRLLNVPHITIALALFGVVLVGCDSTVDSNESSDASVTIAFTSTLTNGTASLGANSTNATIGDDSGNTIRFDRVEIAIGEIEFDRDGSDDSDREDIEKGPFLVDLPLNGEVPKTIVEASVPEGIWDEIEFEIEALDPDDEDAAELLEETGFPEGFSIRVEGEWMPEDGPERNFVFLSDIDEEQEIEFEPPLNVSPDNPQTITLSVDIDSWFRVDSDGTLVNPETANSDGVNKDVVEENIEKFIERDDDDDDDDDDNDDD